MRRTFISPARGDSRRSDVLRWITHGPTGDIVDLDTTLTRETLCTEVSKLRIALHDGKVIPLEGRGSGGILRSFLQRHQGCEPSADS
jgi:hypothetical protein